MKIAFTKMTGAGNDFIVIDNRNQRIRDGAILARQFCDRRWGIGADGLLLLEKSSRASYGMKYFNADGSYGGMCGNGGRCIAYYAYERKIAPRKHSFNALDFTYWANIEENGAVALRMKDPTGLATIVLSVGKRQVRAYVIDTGSPHVVIFARSISRKKDGLSSLDVEALGRKIRYYESFAPTGTNVNFIQRHRLSDISIRTYERGVEAETLACGTGSIASAIIASLAWKLKPPIKVLPRSNVPLFVDFKNHEGRISGARLSGPTKVVYTGTIDWKNSR